MKGSLLIVSGPSGTGKGTICKEVVRRTGVELSISATTRMPRSGEIHGKDYFFLSEEEFVRMIDGHEFIEHVENFGNRYGTPLSFVKEKLNAGKDLILEIDVQGAEKIRRQFPDCILIFVIPPSLTVLRARIEARGTESEDNIAIRLRQALKEVECVREYDYCIVNDELEMAVLDMMGIISAQHNRVGDQADQIIKIFKEA